MKKGFPIVKGVNGITLEMLYAPDPKAMHELIFDMTMETFIKEPHKLPKTPENIKKVCHEVLQGKTLRNALEAIKFTFKIDGVSRTMTHQWVRTRVGANYTQMSMRANNVSNRPVRIPYVVAQKPELCEKWENLIQQMHELYNESIQAGVHYQDARFILPEGITSSITTTMTFNTIQNVLNRRGCVNMQWEVHYVATLLAKAIKEWDPEILGQYVDPLCKQKGVCTWGNVDFPPCNKYPLPASYEVPETGYLFGTEANGSHEFDDFEAVYDKDGNPIG